MTSRAEELAKLLLPIKSFSSGISNPFSYTNTNTSTNTNMSILKIISIILTILLFLFVILLIVHYTVKPIFSFGIGDRFLFPLIKTNDGQLVWTSGPAASDLSANVLKIIPCNITVQQDIYIENQQMLDNKPRVFLYRGSTSIQSTSTDLIANYPNSNLLMYLLPNTNDLTVSIITQSGSTKYIESAPTILNVPIKQPFRVTVVFMQQFIEVYLNGRLSATKALRYRPIQTNTNFYGPPNAFRTSVKTMNFMYWDRPLNSVEVANTGPNLPTSSQFNPSRTELVSSTCS